MDHDHRWVGGSAAAQVEAKGSSAEIHRGEKVLAMAGEPRDLGMGHVAGMRWSDGGHMRALLVHLVRKVSIISTFVGILLLINIRIYTYIDM